MKLFISIILSFFAPSLFGQILFDQGKPTTYNNNLNAYYSKSNNYFGEAKVNEITLNRDATFEFWSRPSVSCFTWHHYKGNWQRIKDTILFADSYDILENDTKATYKRDSTDSFFFTFRTDKSSDLKNKAIRVQFVYDYNAHLENREGTFYMTAENVLEIPFKSIPNLSQLAAIRIEYQLNFTEKRYSYLTENKTINIKQNSVPNIVSVEFVENPKKEVVYRTIKAVINQKTLVIVSTTKTNTTMPDYYRDIEFEESYTLQK